MTEIEEYMENDENGGEIQKKLLQKMDEVAKSDLTYYDFFYEAESGTCAYLDAVFTGDDPDKITPYDMHLAYAVRKRSGLLQVAVYRLLEDGKDYTKMLELDLTHGIAPTYEVDNVPEDLPLDEEDTDTNLSESN